MSEIVNGTDIREPIAVGLSACGALLANGPGLDRMDSKYAQMWEWALDGLAPGEIADAFKEHIKNERFFPTPADIRDRAESARNRRRYLQERAEAEARNAELMEAKQAADAEKNAKDKAWRELPPEEKARLLAEVVVEVRERWRERYGDDGPSRLMESILDDEEPA